MTIEMKNSSSTGNSVSLPVSVIFGIALLAAGCASAPSPAESLARQRGVDIHTLLARSGTYQYAQDSSGHVVAYREVKGYRTGAFEQPRAEVKNFEDNCHANGGRFEQERLGANNLSANLSQSHRASLEQAAATYEFWTRYGISAAGSAMDTYRRQMAVRGRAINSAAFLFDSAVRTENVGTFSCIDADRGALRWRLHYELSNAHKGYVSPGGMYNFPDAYSVYFNETVISYESRQDKASTSGYAALPNSSEGLQYPASGYYVVIEPRGGQWKVASATPYRSSQGSHAVALLGSPKRTNEQQEIVIMSNDGRFAAPAYQDATVNFEPSNNDLFRTRCHVDVIANRKTYSICNSAFADAPREVGAGMSVATMLFGKDANALYNLKLTRTVSFQPETFWRILNEAEVGAEVRAMSSNSPTRGK